MDQLIACHRIFGSCVLGPPQNDYFYGLPWRGSFGRILTMQLEPPKQDAIWNTVADPQDTWKTLTSLCALESPTCYNNTVSIPRPLGEWLEYVQSEDAIWDTVADPQDGITLIIRGDAYPVAGCSWTQLNLSIMDHGHHARTTSHMWVI